MKIPEKRAIRSIVIRRTALIVMSCFVLSVLWFQLKAYSVETAVSADDLIIARVEKGDLIREVRAAGTLEPIEQNFLAATSSGRVKDVLLEAGDAVEIGTVIMTLENPELTQAVDSARFQLDVLTADLSALRQRLHQETLKQRIAVADFNARYEMAKLRSAANQRLSLTGAVSSIDFNESALLREQLKIQHALETERLQSLPALEKAELAAARAKIDKAKRHLELQLELADDLQVKASTKGILQEIPLQEGEQFMLGTALARIAGQDNLKAELRVPESQVKDVVLGQQVVVSAGGKHANGIVKRIDPTVQQGVVLVDVYFIDQMLEGARPDLRVDGVIELEHLKNVLKLKRPVFTQEFSSKILFVVDNDQSSAERKKIEFGSSSVDYIEVRSTLREGDRVVISDTNKYGDINEFVLR